MASRCRRSRVAAMRRPRMRTAMSAANERDEHGDDEQGSHEDTS
jgi:hypothetical protein